MRNTTENLSALQSRMNDLQLENQVLKQLLEQNGISYRREIQALHAPEKLEKYETNQGARIRHPQMITDVMANHFYARFWDARMFTAKEVRTRREKRDIIPNVIIFGERIVRRPTERKFPADRVLRGTINGFKKKIFWRICGDIPVTVRM